MFLFSVCLIFLSPITIFSVASLSLPGIEKFKQTFLQTVDHKTKKTVHILELKCTTTGNPKPDVEFQFNGKRLQKNDSKIKYLNENTVQIWNLTYPEDEGIYRCMTKNANGNVFEEKSIKVPTIGSFYPGQGENGKLLWHDVNLGEEIEVICPGHTHAYPLKYFWGVRNKDSTFTFIDKESPLIHTTDNGRLIITSVTDKIVDRIRSLGGIRCMLRMGEAEAPEWIYSRPIALLKQKNATIRNTKPLLMHYMAGNFYAEEGSSVTLGCIAKGNPLPTMLWFRNGSQIDSSDSDFVLNEHGTSLTIKNVSESKRGLYACVAKNKNGEDSRAGELKIAQPASLIDTLQSVTKVPQANKLRLICEASGTKPISYFWYRNGSQLSDYCFDGVCMKINDGVLEINYVNKSDKGQYQCTVRNRYGSDSSIGRVVVTKAVVRPTSVTGKNLSNNGTGGDKDAVKPDPNEKGNKNSTKQNKKGPLTTQHIIIIACGGTVVIILAAGAIFICCRSRNATKEVRFIPTPRHELNKPIFLERDDSHMDHVDFPPPPKSFTDSEDDGTSYGSVKLNDPHYRKYLMELKYKDSRSATPENLYYDIPEDHSVTTPMTEL